jgi:hypothetical protein
MDPRLQILKMKESKYRDAENCIREKKSMEVMPIPPEILDHARGALTSDNSEAQHSVGGIAGYRCKVYRAALNLETDRHSVALSKHKFSLFQKASRETAAKSVDFPL